MTRPCIKTAAQALEAFDKLTATRQITAALGASLEHIRPGSPEWSETLLQLQACSQATFDLTWALRDFLTLLAQL